MDIDNIDFEIKVYTTRKGNLMFTTASCENKGCSHAKGCFWTIPFGPFRKRIYVCADCYEVFYGKKLRELKIK